MISLEADVAGQFVILNEDGLIANTFDYAQSGSYTNYYVNFNITHRGINTVNINFYPVLSNFANVSVTQNLYVYDKVIIQSVQTNASFYQLGSYILFKGVATIGSNVDSLNGIRVSLLLNNKILANTSIETNGFTFIVQTPETIGLKKYDIAIFADNMKFIITSDVYELTVSIINDFGLNFKAQDYQVGDTIQIAIYGQEQRLYSLFYTINGLPVTLLNFQYNQSFEYNFQVEYYGHYLIYLEEKSTQDQTYYALNVLQNPIVQFENGILMTYTNNIVQLAINKYNGTYRLNFDGLYKNYDSYFVNGNVTTNIELYSIRPGNHSVTILFQNEYTLEKVRTYYFMLYQKVELSNFTTTPSNGTLTEEENVEFHFIFKEFTNQSINDIPLRIITNDNTILAQANIFNSVSDMQITVLGNNLSLVIGEVQDKYIHEEIIPLNLTVFKLITSDIQENYSFDAVTTMQMHFAYKYFPSTIPFELNYILTKDGQLYGENTTIGQQLSIQITENGNYSLIVTANGKNCVNRTWIANILVNKFFDISNTSLMTVIGIVGAIPVMIIGITIMKKKKT